jgi:uncharacterized protein
MTNEEILAAFIRPEAFPEAAVRLAGERREEIAPLLVAEIEAWAEGRRTDVKDYYYLVDAAFHLLAEWRDRSGFKPMLALLASPHFEVLGDTVTESAAGLLARLYDGDAAALEALVLDPAADEFVRDAALEAHSILVARGAIAREDGRAFLLHVFEAVPHATHYIWCGWQRAVSDLLFEDLAPKVKQLFEEEAIDITWMDYEDFESDLAAARGGSAKPWPDRDESPLEAMRNWRYLEPGEADRTDDPGDRAAMDEALRAAFGHGPAVNPYRDVGRNDPCPCGSGKKFKKCCLSKAEAGLL